MGGAAGRLNGGCGAAAAAGGAQPHTGMSSLGSRFGRGRDVHRLRRSCSSIHSIKVKPALYYKRFTRR